MWTLSLLGDKVWVQPQGCVVSFPGEGFQGYFQKLPKRYSEGKPEVEGFSEETIYGAFRLLLWEHSRYPRNLLWGILSSHNLKA